MRYLIKFSKESQIKFVSHLDLLRTLQRIIRRTSLPVVYSQGFNPHMSTSIAQPLSVGMYSAGEYMDVEFTEELEENYIKEKMNANVPAGIKVFEVIRVKEQMEGKKVPQSMALIDAAKYLIKIKYNATSKLQEELDNLLNEKEWNIAKKSKSGEKVVNIKELVKTFEYEIKERELLITALVSCGSRENLSADLLAQFIKNNTGDVLKDAFVDIMREEMYVNVQGAFIPMHVYVK